MSERTDDALEPDLLVIQNDSARPSKGKELVAGIAELALLVLIAFSLAWLIKSFVMQPFYIPSASMEPTLVPHDHVLVNKFIYRFQDPRRGDIMVFEYPLDPNKDYIKRLVGVPGDRIKVVGGVVYRNGEKLKEPYLANPGDSSDFPAGGGQIVVPKNKYFMMGDNRGNSADSRMWGFLPKKNVVGKAFVIYFPFTRVGSVN